MYISEEYKKYTNAFSYLFHEERVSFVLLFALFPVMALWLINEIISFRRPGEDELLMIMNCVAFFGALLISFFYARAKHPRHLFQQGNDSNG